MFGFDFVGSRFTLSATKCNDGHSGLVRASGWSSVVARGKTVVITILDEDVQQGWTRTTDCGQSLSEPLEVNIPRSSVGHRIKVTAKSLKSRSTGGVEHLEVAYESSCIASDELATADADANSLAHLLSAMSMSPVDAIQPSGNLQVSIEQNTTFSKAKVVIRYPSIYPTHWEISVLPSVKPNPYASCIEHFFILRRQGIGVREEFEFPISFKAGRKYRIVVQGLAVSSQHSTFFDNGYFRIIGTGSAEFKAELTMVDVQSLHAKCLEHVRWSGSALCVCLYRNKPQPYFDDIFQNHGGLMEVYMKDNSGDRGSPINDRIKGLFFMASVEPGSTSGQPIRDSAFGGTRLIIPAETLLKKAPNLYFADFYCMRGQFHYVTLVMTRPGSETDVFCSQRLLSLSVHDRTNNPFLFYDEFGQLQVSAKGYLRVEVLFTENLDINQYRYDLKQYTPLVGKGQTTPGGVPKNAKCTICNLSLAGYNPCFLAHLVDDF